MLAGLIVGPHVPLPLVADPEVIHTLSEIGVILLMFSLGLEFRVRKLVALGPTAGFTALVQCSIMLWVGFEIGRAFGFTVRESVFSGAIVAISSTTIIAKVFGEELRLRGGAERGGADARVEAARAAHPLCAGGLSACARARSRARAPCARR